MSNDQYGRGRRDGQGRTYNPPKGDGAFGFGESKKSIGSKKAYSDGWRQGSNDRKRNK